MNYDELCKKLKQLKNEDLVWLIYIGIIIMSWYSNQLERNYFLYKDLKSKDSYRKTLIFIFAVLIVIYFYFFKGSYDDIKNLKSYDTEKKKNLTNLSFLGSLLILLSGFVFLYIAIMDEEIDVELAFN